MIIITPDGTEVPVFAVDGGTYVDTCIRATNLEVWEAVAASQALLIRDDDGGFLPAPGAMIDHIGSVEIAPAVLGADGGEVTPAVMDARHHLNLRITDPLLSKKDANGYSLWARTALKWMASGSDAPPNNEERAKDVFGVQMVDPSSIRVPARVWA